MNKLDRSFYLRDTVTVAKELLGKQMVHRVDGQELVVEITETEAYTGVEDKACHAYGGRRTQRTETLYCLGGHAYIYLCYGMYNLFNVVTEPQDIPCAVLVRGGKVVQGLDSICKRRFDKGYEELKPAQKRALLDGPGKFCKGLGLDRGLNREDLLGNRLFLLDSKPQEPFTMGVGKRIGIDYAEEAVDFPYRFYQIPVE